MESLFSKVGFKLASLGASITFRTTQSDFGQPRFRFRRVQTFGGGGVYTNVGMIETILNVIQYIGLFTRNSTSVHV